MTNLSTQCKLTPAHTFHSCRFFSFHYISPVYNLSIISNFCIIISTFVSIACWQHPLHPPPSPLMFPALLFVVSQNSLTCCQNILSIWNRVVFLVLGLITGLTAELVVISYFLLHHHIISPLSTHSREKTADLWSWGGHLNSKNKHRSSPSRVELTNTNVLQLFVIHMSSRCFTGLLFQPSRHCVFFLPTIEHVNSFNLSGR